MKIRLIFFLFYLLALESKSQDKLTGLDFLSGVIRTCVTDSTAFLNADTIVIELKVMDHNNNCPNKPKISGCCAPWPSGVAFMLDRNVIFLDTNKELVDKNKDNVVESLAHIPRQGKFKYSEKSNTIKITFKQYMWTKTFKVWYNKNDQILTLTTTM